MALMKHREGNEIKWVGVRPGHRGELIGKNKRQTSTGVGIIHTVTAGKTFFLTFGSLTICRRGTSGYGRLAVRDAGDDVVYVIFEAYANSDTQGFNFGSGFPFPVEIPAGYDIIVESGATNVLCCGTAIGWEE